MRVELRELRSVRGRDQAHARGRTLGEEGQLEIGLNGRAGLVEDGNRWLSEKQPREGEPLLLPGGEAVGAVRAPEIGDPIGYKSVQPDAMEEREQLVVGWQPTNERGLTRGVDVGIRQVCLERELRQRVRALGQHEPRGGRHVPGQRAVSVRVA